MTTSVPISDIIIEKRKLALRDGALDALKQSIKDVGLLFAPLVRKTTKGYKLVAGAHRVEACRQLGWKTIPIEVEREHRDDKWAEIAEIDENLIRRSISKAEKAKIVGARYRLVGSELRSHFATQTARQTGASRDEVKRDLNRAVELGVGTLNKIKGTSLDTGAEMDALRKLPKSKRSRLVAAAAKGENVSAITGARKNPIVNAWSKAGDEDRRDFLAHLRRIKAI